MSTLLHEKSVRMPLTQEEIAAALTRAREAVSTNRSQVARDAGFDYGVLQKYEGARQSGDPNWVYPIQYMAWLAAQNSDARAEILALLGIPTTEAVEDVELARRMRVVEDAYRKGIEIDAVRRLWDALEGVIRELERPRVA